MAVHWAPHIERVRGPAVDGLNLSELEPVPEVAGVTDTWRRGAETVIAIYRAEAQLFGDPALQVATIYSDIAEAAIYLDF
jgi:hypothetical protein